MLTIIGLSVVGHTTAAFAAPCDDNPAFGWDDNDTYDDPLFTTNYQTQLTVVAPGVLANDDGVPYPNTHVIVPAPNKVETDNGGTVVWQQNSGGFKYTPPAGFGGVDSFTYDMTDACANDSFATVYIVVRPS